MWQRAGWSRHTFIVPAGRSRGCRPPSKDELAAIARGYGMHLSEEDLGSFEPMVAGLLTSYDAVGELYAQAAPQPPAGRPKEVRRQINAASMITPGSV